MVTNIFFIIAAYLIGSLSSAIIVCKCFGLADPRTMGSKNPGATNVMRLGGKLPALLTLLGDGIKGLVPTLLASCYLQNPWVVGAVMLAAFLGHIFPIFFGFQGGKGVATAIGCYLGLYWPIGVCIFLLWAGVIKISRISSLGAIFAALFAPIIGWLFLHDPIITIFMTIISVILLVRHRGNLARLWQGTEGKI